jgi:hypothetical protein
MAFRRIADTIGHNIMVRPAIQRFFPAANSPHDLYDRISFRRAADTIGRTTPVRPVGANYL